MAWTGVAGATAAATAVSVVAPNWLIKTTDDEVVVADDEAPPPALHVVD
nr:hypothetical protein [Mycobacterium kyorinense]